MTDSRRHAPWTRPPRLGQTTEHLGARAASAWIDRASLIFAGAVIARFCCGGCASTAPAWRQNRQPTTARLFTAQAVGRSNRGWPIGPPQTEGAGPNRTRGASTNVAAHAVGIRGRPGPWLQRISGGLRPLARRGSRAGHSCGQTNASLARARPLLQSGLWATSNPDNDPHYRPSSGPVTPASGAAIRAVFSAAIRPGAPGSSGAEIFPLANLGVGLALNSVLQLTLRPPAGRQAGRSHRPDGRSLHQPACEWPASWRAFAEARPGRLAGPSASKCRRAHQPHPIKR